MKVLDASIVLKWFLKEEDTDITLRLKEDIVAGSLSVAVPDLIIYELSNALRFKKNYNVATVFEAVDAVMELGMDIIVPTKDLIKSAIKLSFTYHVSFYDALYIALAQDLGYEFLTADEELFSKIKRLPQVNLLKNLSS